MTLPRCNDHKTRETLPTLCHTCQRIAVEHNIERTIRALLAVGFTLRESEDETLCVFEKDIPALLDLLFNLDSFLTVFRAKQNGKLGERENGYVEDVLKPINDYADTLSV